MTRVGVIRSDDVVDSATYLSTVDVAGLRSAKRLTPDDFPLQMYVTQLDAGGTLRWNEHHDDEAIYVMSGSLQVVDTPCVAGGAVVVEAGVAMEVFVTEDAAIVHCARAPEALSTNRGGRCAHVVEPTGWYQSGARDGVSAVWFTDSTCPTCDVALFRVDKEAEKGAGPNHSHSADELIYVLDGSLRFGRQDLEPGTCLSIAANQRYTVGPGDHGYSFLNYRPTGSGQKNFPREGDPFEEPEGGLARGGRLIGAVRDVPPA